jgi:hypothetical protein
MFNRLLMSCTEVHPPDLTRANARSCAVTLGSMTLSIPEVCWAGEHQIKGENFKLRHYPGVLLIQHTAEICNVS